jgi:hypothetical protein
MSDAEVVRGLYRAEQVTAGAAYLDTSFPGWVDLIDLDILRLINPRNCVLGQLYGTFFRAPLVGERDDAVLTEQVTDPLGFDIHYQFRTKDGVPDFSDKYYLLTATWKALIEGRRARTTEGITV